MVQQLALSVTDIFIRKEVIPKEDGEIYAFGFECMLATALQVIILLAVGLLLKCLILVVIFTIYFALMKGYIGGWHANSHFTCISGFTATAVGMVFLCGILPEWMVFAFLSVGLTLIFALAPIQHKNNPKTKDEISHGRKMALLVALAEAIGIFAILVSPYAQYAIYGAGGLFLSALSLIIPNRR